MKKIHMFIKQIMWKNKLYYAIICFLCLSVGCDSYTDQEIQKILEADLRHNSENFHDISSFIAEEGLHYCNDCILRRYRAESTMYLECKNDYSECLDVNNEGNDLMFSITYAFLSRLGITKISFSNGRILYEYNIRDENLNFVVLINNCFSKDSLSRSTNILQNCYTYKH